MVQSQFGLAPLAIKTSIHVDGSIMTSQGMTMYVLDSRKDLQTVTDLEGAVVRSQALHCSFLSSRRAG